MAIRPGERWLSATAQPSRIAEVHQPLRHRRNRSTKATAARREGDEILLDLSDGRTLTGDRLLVAVGRKPLSENVGLESLGLQGGGYIDVDEHMRVAGLPWFYAVGDVNGRSLLTHSGNYQARVAVDCILGEEALAWADVERAPRVIFTEPEVAAVGLMLDRARSDGIQAGAFDVSTNGNAGGSFVGRGTEGKTRFVVDMARKNLVGVTFVGVDIQNFLQAATLAVVAEIPLSTLAHGSRRFRLAARSG